MDETELKLRGQVDFLERREAELAHEEARLPTVGYHQRTHQKVQEALSRVQEELEVAKGALRLFESSRKGPSKLRLIQGGGP